MSAPTKDASLDVYVTAVDVNEIFVDSTYQRVCEVARSRKMAHAWDRRLAGILEVSDRGEDAHPRYAVIDGQHRWAAARSLIKPPTLVVNVHTGLSVADEAVLFDKLNRQRKQTTTWDHWKARRVSGDPFVEGIENTVHRVDLVVSEAPRDGSVRCIGTLEKIAKTAGGLSLLKDTLQVIKDTWGKQFDAYDAPLVGGVALLLSTFGDQVDWDILVDSLIDLPPRRIKYLAQAKRDTQAGSLLKLVTVTLIERYNTTAKRGSHLRVPLNLPASLRAAKAAS